MIKIIPYILAITIITILFSNLTLAIIHTNPTISSENPEIIVGPYSQYQKENSIIIIWETNNKTSDNYVRWGETPECNNITYVSQSNSIPGTNIQQVKIHMLKPSTMYYYKAVSDNTESDIYTFSTAYDSSKPITFCVYGDTRGSWDNWKNGSIVAKAIEQRAPYFVIHTGDIVDNGLIKAEWHSFFNISSFMHNSTFYATLGNHENYGKHFFKYFNPGGNERWYSFDNGPVHFICLDSNYIAPFNPVQNLWLIRDLRQNHQPFTIVFFHYPMYSSGSHGSTTYLQWFWQPLFEIFSVDMVFNGHDHTYERGLVNNITYFVAGGGGAPLYSVGSSWWTQHSEKTFHYCLVTANETSLSLETIKPDGDIIDAITIIK
jgi:3',5'-cyclic AMP phosphodiesterase CpdA